MKCGRGRLSWTTQVLPEQRVPASRSASCPGQWKVGCKHWDSDCLPRNDIFVKKKKIWALFFFLTQSLLSQRKTHQSCRRTDTVRIARFWWDSEGACLWWIADNQTCWAAQQRGGSDIYKLALIACSPWRSTPDYPDIPDPRTCRCIHARARTHSITISGNTRPEQHGSN